MLDIIINVTSLLAIGTLVIHIVAAVFLISTILNKLGVGNGFYDKWLNHLRWISIPTVFVIGLVSMLGSLFYSELAKYPPCLLCWYQRIAMYPIVFLTATGMLRKDSGKQIAVYAMPLAIVGGLIALYHVIVQMLEVFTAVDADKLVPCTNVGVLPSCTDFFFMEFGYITMPVMSLTGFILIIFFLALNLGASGEKQ